MFGINARFQCSKVTVMIEKASEKSFFRSELKIGSMVVVTLASNQSHHVTEGMSASDSSLVHTDPTCTLKNTHVPRRVQGLGQITW